jgi:putative lipoic acid-binding regulatory protein
MERLPDHRPSVELLESTHPFPGSYTIKAIGLVDDDFEQRVVAAVSAHLAAASDLDYSIRATRGGRHIALTLEINVQNAEQVRSIYGQIRDVRGLTLLF